MNVLFLTWSDQNNCNAARSDALNRCSDDMGRCWAVAGRNEFGGHINFASSLKEAMDWCDVVHVSDTYPFEFKVFGSAKRGWFDDIRAGAGKPRVFEFKGGFLRMYSAVFWNWQAEFRVPIITTPDLGRYVPRFHYLPIPIDVWDKRLEPVERDNKLLKVCQSPSRRDYKDTDALVRVCDKLDGVELVLLEGLERDECLEEKRGCDAYFGKFKVGDIGLSEREALAMGLVVLCRLQPLVLAHNPNCPVVNTGDEAALEEKLTWAYLRTYERENKKLESRDWAENFLSFEAVGPRMSAFYDYVVNGDDWDWWSQHAAIWQAVAKKEHGIDRFVSPKEVRW